MRKQQNNHLLASFQNQLEERYDKMLAMQSEIELMATIIAANNELKVGAGRAGFFTAEILHMRMMIAKEIVGEDDPELLYTRHNLAKRLKEIYGKDWGKFRELFPMLKEYWD